MAQKKNKVDQSLVEFVTQLKDLNDIEVEIPQVNIDDVINDPKQYALDFIELEFAKMVPRFLEAYKLGNKFGKKNK